MMYCENSPRLGTAGKVQLSISHSCPGCLGVSAVEDADELISVCSGFNSNSGRKRKKTLQKRPRDPEKKKGKK